MHCGDTRLEILSRSPRLTPRRCGVSQRQCLPPTLSSLWLSQRIRDSSPSAPRSTRPQVRFRSSGWERAPTLRSEEHTSELQSQSNLVCRLLLEKKKKKKTHVNQCKI